MQSAPPTRSAAFRFRLKLGCISFGGPAGQIALMHEELVVRRRWISERRFLQALNYCMVLPGPEAQQLATYLGWLMHRTSGGIIAGALFVLPSFVLLVALALVYVMYGQQPQVAGIFAGIKPAVTAIVLHAAWRIGGRVLTGAWPWTLATTAFLGTAVLDVPFPVLVTAAWLAGWMVQRSGGAGFANKPAHGSKEKRTERAWIDDLSPLPDHTRFSGRRLVVVVASGLSLWVAGMAVIALTAGTQHPLFDMGLFFTRAALLTFGGAYAVLPYVFDGAVNTCGWVTAEQMIDALALGESTPGPLIMVVTFVGFVAGFTLEILAGASPALSGLVAALVVTGFTFLPSFVFILAGGPLIESGRNIDALHAPLAAITAAVVGVIVNLAFWFALHVFFPQGASGATDWTAMIIATAAGVALFGLGRSVIEVITAAALTGMLLSFF